MMQQQFDLASTISSDSVEQSAQWSIRLNEFVIVDHMSFKENTVGNNVSAPMGALEVSDDWCECICSECRKSDKLKALMKSHYDNVGPTNEFDYDQYVICPPRFLGYGMQRKKKWIQMPVNGVQEYKDKIKTNAFEKLILEQNQKELIKSLARGMDKGDLNRNSLVTGFLRILEYNEGILILTTNRIRTFDVAVQSRVHLAVRYSNMQTPELRKLFMRFLEGRRSEIANYRELENWVQEDFDEGIDGRQIRNIVSSAMALAKNEDNDDGKLRLPHIKRVLKMTTQFHNSWYLKVRYGAIFGDWVLDAYYL